VAQVTVESLLAALHAMDSAAEPEPRSPTVRHDIRELKRETQELLDQIERDKQEQATEERIETELAKRLDQIIENTKPRKPEPEIYRSELGPAEKSRLMEKLGTAEYLELPLYRPGASRKWGRR
jgi:hypothetical protein